MKNSKRIYNSLMLIIVVAIVTFILTSVFVYKKLGNTSTYANTQIINSDFVKKIYTLRSIMQSKYVSKVKEDDLINGAIKGYVDGLGDEYTEYFTKQEMEEFLTDTEGNYVGVRNIYVPRCTK